MFAAIGLVCAAAIGAASGRKAREMKMGKWYAASAVIVAAITGIAVVLTWGPEESRQWMHGAGLWVVTVVGPVLTAFLTRDADNDGRPDWLQWMMQSFWGVLLGLLILEAVVRHAL